MKINPQLSDVDNFFNMLVFEKILSPENKHGFNIEILPVYLHIPGQIDSKGIQSWTKATISYLDKNIRQYKEVQYQRIIPIDERLVESLTMLDRDTVSIEAITNWAEQYLLTSELVIDDSTVEEARNGFFNLRAKSQSLIYHSSAQYYIPPKTLHYDIRLSGFLDQYV